MRKFLFFFTLLLLVNQAFAYELYFYNNEHDWRDNVRRASSDRFDAYDFDVVADVDKYNCIDLDQQRYLAGLNKHDANDPWTAENIRKSDFEKLDYDDQLRIINEDPYDSLDETSINNYNDMNCWSLRGYNSFAEEDHYDKWDPVYFDDPDDDERTLNRIGVQRYGLVSPTYFAELTGQSLTIEQPTNFPSVSDVGYDPYYLNNPIYNYGYFG